MSDLTGFRRRLLERDFDNFEEFAMEIFQWQVACNPLYKSYVSYLKRDASAIHRLEDVPFLPIEFFKGHTIKTDVWSDSLIFSSSGTTGSTPSYHHLDSPWFYEELTTLLFEEVYGPLKEFHIIALLPSYLERSGSSLIHMADHFIRKTGSSYSGFFLREDEKLRGTLEELSGAPGKKLLLGVTFALLGLAGKGDIDLSDFIVMETGGMKGRGRELTRDELHSVLKKGLNVSSVHSEYGMTELMSQAYAPGAGQFTEPFSLKVMVRDVNDPFSFFSEKKTGGLNIVDLGNLHSCCFIETKDLGRKTGESRKFEVLGRFDNSDIRGCNLMIS